MLDDVFTELGALELGRTFHQASEVIGHVFRTDGTVEAFDDEVCGFVPAHVAEHHFAGEHDGTRIDLIFVSILRCGAVSGFKNGVPVDADFVFDARCLPNPYWDDNLKSLTGLDQAVIDFLVTQDDATAMQTDIADFLAKWLPRFEASNRSYMTVAIGCTGGQHRSVFLCEQLKQLFSGQISNVQVLHRELSRPEALKKS